MDDGKIFWEVFFQKDVKDCWTCGSKFACDNNLGKYCKTQRHCWCNKCNPRKEVECGMIMIQRSSKWERFKRHFKFYVKPEPSDLNE